VRKGLWGRKWRDVKETSQSRSQALYPLLPLVVGGKTLLVEAGHVTTQQICCVATTSVQNLGT